MSRAGDPGRRSTKASGAARFSRFVCDHLTMTSHDHAEAGPGRCLLHLVITLVCAAVRTKSRRRGIQLCRSETSRCATSFQDNTSSKGAPLSGSAASGYLQGAWRRQKVKTNVAPNSRREIWTILLSISYPPVSTLPTYLYQPYYVAWWPEPRASTQVTSTTSPTHSTFDETSNRRLRIRSSQIARWIGRDQTHPARYLA